MLEEAHKGKDSVDFCKILLPFTVVRFDVGRQAKDVLLPGKIAKFVPDAFHTQEHWILSPTVPTNTSRLWLVGGNIVAHSLLLNGEKQKYFMVYDSKWSETEQFADKDFVKNLLNIAKMWLTQSREPSKNSPKPSLFEQIDFAEKEKSHSVVNNFFVKESKVCKER